MKFISKSPNQTEKIAGKLARKVVEIESSTAIVIGLEGELGAGKTVFVKGFAAALGISKGIKSPTFNLMKRYRIDLRSNPPAGRAGNIDLRKLYHLDCYRLNSGEDLKALAFDELLADEDNIILIEWAERVRDALPKKYIKVHIDHVDKNSRRIFISQ